MARVPRRAGPGRILLHPRSPSPARPGRLRRGGRDGQAIVADNLGTGSDTGWASSPVSFAATAARSTCDERSRRWAGVNRMSWRGASTVAITFITHVAPGRSGAMSLDAAPVSASFPQRQRPSGSAPASLGRGPRRRHRLTDPHRAGHVVCGVAPAASGYCSSDGGVPAVRRRRMYATAPGTLGSQ